VAADSSPATETPRLVRPTALTKPLLSPRRRRLRITITVLAALAILGSTLGVFVYFKSQPAQYRPDETSADITSDLARNLPADAPRPGFNDVTRAAGLAGFRNFTGARTSEMPEDIGPGLAWGDFDNDRDDDLFLVSAGGAMNVPANQLQPCALFENLGNGGFRRVTGFPELRIHGTGAAWSDYDGDGFLDLVVSGYQVLLLFHSEAVAGGGRRFVRDGRLLGPPGFWTGVSWGDYDNDRAPDLYVCGYIDYVVADEDRAKSSLQVGAKVPFTLNPASFNGGTNLLFHNNRDGTFTEVGAQLKVQNPEGRSLGALWHDFDGDGWLDLYVANDISDNVFFRNTGGKFEDISHPALAADHRSAMGLAVGDYNRDGDDDLFITHWVAQENALYDNTWADFNLRRTSTNSVPAKKYPLRFMDIADMKGLGQIALPYVGWGTEFVDFDGDGWLDLAVANGNTLEEDGPVPKRLKPQETMLFWNRRGEFFHNVAPLHPGLGEKHNSRGLAVSDFDDDGDMDLIMADLGEGVRLFRNEMQAGRWLKVRLRSRNHRSQSVGFADGSTAIAHLAGGVSLRRSVSSVSYLSQSSRTLHFGLGPAAKIDRLEVRWHAGGTNVFEKVDADATYEVTEDEPAPRKLMTDVTRTPPDIRNEQSRATPAAIGQSDKQRRLDFWNKQRGAMNAMKVEKDNAKAIPLFREALALDPVHEDSLYYLATCLASTGDTEDALTTLAELKRINPQSQRAFAQWGTLRALAPRTPADLAAAEESLLRAHAINPEETGALLVLGEIAFLRGDANLADERLSAACRTNPKAVGGFFLRGYHVWKRGDDANAKKLLEDARAALSKDWQPKGATSEGDVKQKQHVETAPLARFWERWDGSTEPAHAFAKLDGHLSSRTPP
jgi:enediyne biosynthesis protein E4